MENWKLLLGVIGGTLALVFGVSVLFSGEQEVKLLDQELVVGDARNVRYGGVVESDEATGSGRVTESEESSGSAVSEVVVTIVEFSDFQCPACRSASGLVEQVVEQGEGKVRLVYRHFPLEGLHENAFRAAEASEVMADNGMFWEFHDMLFEKQDEWAEEEDVDGILASYAGELGVDEQKFFEGFDSSEVEKRVRDDYNAGLRVGVNATPTFVVNGEAVGANRLQATVVSKLSGE